MTLDPPELIEDLQLRAQVLLAGPGELEAVGAGALEGTQVDLAEGADRGLEDGALDERLLVGRLQPREGQLLAVAPGGMLEGERVLAEQTHVGLGDHHVAPRQLVEVDDVIVLGARGGLVDDLDADLVQAQGEVGVLAAVVAEGLVEASDLPDQVGGNADVARPEGAPVVALPRSQHGEAEDEGVVLEHSHQRVVEHLLRLLEAAEHGDLPRLTGVGGEVALDEFRVGDRVVVDEQDVAPLSDRQAGVARGGQTAVLAVHDQGGDLVVPAVEQLAGAVVRPVVDHDDLVATGRGLLLEGAQAAREGVLALVGADEDRQVGAFDAQVEERVVVHRGGRGLQGGDDRVPGQGAQGLVERGDLGGDGSRGARALQAGLGEVAVDGRAGEAFEAFEAVLGQQLIGMHEEPVALCALFEGAGVHRAPHLEGALEGQLDAAQVAGAAHLLQHALGGDRRVTEHAHAADVGQAGGPGRERVAEARVLEGERATGSEAIDPSAEVGRDLARHRGVEGAQPALHRAGGPRLREGVRDQRLIDPVDLGRLEEALGVRLASGIGVVAHEPARAGQGPRYQARATTARTEHDEVAPPVRCSAALRERCVQVCGIQRAAQVEAQGGVVEARGRGTSLAPLVREARPVPVEVGAVARVLGLVRIGRVEHEGVEGDAVAPAGEPHAQRHVVVLETPGREGLVEAPDRVDHRAAQEHRQGSEEVRVLADALVGSVALGREGGDVFRGVAAVVGHLLELRGPVGDQRDGTHAGIDCPVVEGAREPAGRHVDVVVEVGHPLPRGGLRRLVASTGRAEVRPIADQAQVRLLGQPLGAAVARAVVDHDPLGREGVVLRGAQVFDAAPGRLDLIAGDDHDAGQVRRGRRSKAQGIHVCLGPVHASGERSARDLFEQARGLGLGLGRGRRARVAFFEGGERGLELLEGAAVLLDPVERRCAQRIERSLVVAAAQGRVLMPVRHAGQIEAALGRARKILRGGDHAVLLGTALGHMHDPPAIQEQAVAQLEPLDRRLGESLRVEATGAAHCLDRQAQVVGAEVMPVVELARTQLRGRAPQVGLVEQPHEGAAARSLTEPEAAEHGGALRGALVGRYVPGQEVGCGERIVRQQEHQRTATALEAQVARSRGAARLLMQDRQRIGEALGLHLERL